MSSTDSCVTSYTEFIIRAYHTILQSELCRNSAHAYDLYISHIPSDIEAVLHYCGYDTTKPENKELVETLTQQIIKSVTADAPRPTERKRITQSCHILCATQTQALEIVVQQLAAEGNDQMLKLWQMEPLEGKSLKLMTFEMCMMICASSDTHDQND